MAITLEANYSKKLGLPGYSSHQYSVTIKTEISDPSQVQAESSKLYQTLQTCVDREIQNIGFLPEPKGNGKSSLSTGNGNGGGDAWACSPRQRDLILKIVEDNHLDKSNVEALAQDRFGKPVRGLNKLEASGLIDELLTQTTGRGNGNELRRFQGRPATANSR